MEISSEISCVDLLEKDFYGFGFDELSSFETDKTLLVL